MYLQQPIPTGTRVVVVTRFSKEEQRRQSTTDQFDYCHEFIRDHCTAPGNVDHIQDEGISGEIRDRPGIRELRAKIEARQVDLIICEDSSRLYRDTALCLDLVGRADEREIRVICLNDFVDTRNEGWKSRLEEAQRHHSQDNQYTRHRIKRAHDGLFRMGAAIGILRPGYLRRRRDPADPKSPKFDEIDSDREETIKKAYQSVADKKRLEDVGASLTRAGLPKSANSTRADWTPINVISLIRCTKYRGFETFRDTISKKFHTTGRSHSVKNKDRSKVLSREMPHLRIVDDALWYAANKAIDDRAIHSDGPTGIDHPLHAIPRDSRGPLSTVFVCGICGAKMHMEGRNEGGYRCSAARQGNCWNKTTALRGLTHQHIGAAVSSAILQASEAVVPELLQFLKEGLASLNDLRQQKTEIEKRFQALKVVEERFLRMIGQDDDAPASLKAELKRIDSDAAAMFTEIQSLEYRIRTERTVPRQVDLLAHVREVGGQLSLDAQTAGSLLRALLHAPIRAIPCQQLGCKKIVLRAEITLNLVELLPDQLRLQVQDRPPLGGTPDVLLRQITVDLFEPSLAPRHALQALKIYQREPDVHPTLEKIAEELGTSKRTTHLALQMGRALQAAGRTDPFVAITECPENPGRWRFRKVE